MSKSPGQSPPKRLRRVLIAATVLVLAVGLLGVALSTRLADIAHPRVETLLTDVFGRPVAIGDLSISLLGRRVEVEDFSIGGLAGGPPLLRVERGEARVALRPLLRRAVKLRRVSLHGVDGGLTLRDDGSFEPILAEAVAAKTEADDEGSEPWSVHIAVGEVRDARLGIRSPRAGGTPIELDLDRADVEGFAVIDGRVAVDRIQVAAGARLRGGPDSLPEPAAEAEDQEPSEPVSLHIATIDIDGLALELTVGSTTTPASVDIHAQDFQLTAPFDIEAEMTLEAGGGLAAQGRLGVHEPSFAGTIRWRDVAFGSVRPLFEAAGPLPDGTGTASGIVSVQLLPGPALTASGSISLADVAIDDLSEELSWLSLPRAEVAIGAIELAPQEPLRIHLGRVRLESPEVSYHAIEEASVETEEETQEEASTLPSLRVDRLEIEDGSVRLHDSRVEPPIETLLSQITASAEEVAFPESTVRALAMDLRSTSSQRIEMSGALTDEGQTIDLAMDGVELTAIRGYMAGTPLADVRGGTLTLRSAIQIRTETVHADSHMILNDLALGSILDPGLDDLLGVPLDAAILLLRDSDGSIEMHPSLVLERGKSNLVRIVRDTVILAFRGAINAPMKGIERLGLGVVSFATRGRSGVRSLLMVPGKTTLEATAVVRVKRLGEILAKGPKLRVVLRGRSSDADGSDVEARSVLANARAAEIQAILTGTHGVAPDRITLADPIEGKPGVGVVFVDER